MYDDYENLIERLRECSAEQNGEKTLWCQAADAIDNLLYICKHQATEIEELRKAVLQLEDESGLYDELPTVYIFPTKWIPVTERLPEEGKFVLVYGDLYPNKHDGGVIAVSKRIDWNYWQGFGRERTITHWMPLPEKP